MNLTDYKLHDGQVMMILVIVLDKMGVKAYECPSIYVHEAKKWYSNDIH